MKRVLLTVGKIATLSVMCLFVANSLAFAGSQDDARIALHIQGHQAKPVNICAGAAGSVDPNTLDLSCRDYNTNWPAFLSGDLYLTVGLGSTSAGIGGLSCGVNFPPTVGNFGWTLCADLEFSNGGWPASGGGNRITWETAGNCQNADIGLDGAHAIAGSFYVYAYGDATFDVISNNGVATPELKVADCAAAESDLVIEAAGQVGFGTEPGYNPCNAVPTENTTWGAIKSLFDGE